MKEGIFDLKQSTKETTGKSVVEVLATPGRGSDRPHEICYTDTKIIGNGSFGVVYSAKLVGTNDVIAIKKVDSQAENSILTIILGFTRQALQKSRTVDHEAN